MWWYQFADAAAALAARLRAEFENAGVVLVATVRRDGAPRISAIEPVFDDGQLYLDMMASRKANDALRDPRVEVHAMLADRSSPQYKLRGHLVEVLDDAECARFARVTLDRLGWEPYSGHHLFRVDVRTATWISFGENAPDGHMRMRTWHWRRGFEERGPSPPRV